MANIFYGHAKTRLKERNVTEAEVEKVIADPDIVTAYAPQEGK